MLYKLLALYDFEHLREVGVPALELDYKAMENGPVPVTLYEEAAQHTSTDEYEFKQGFKQNVREVWAKGKPQNDYLSHFQKEIIDKWILILADHSTQAASDVSHEVIKAWKTAWNRRGDMNVADMSYKDEFGQEEIPEEFYAYLQTR